MCRVMIIQLMLKKRLHLNWRRVSFKIKIYVIRITKNRFQTLYKNILLLWLLLKKVGSARLGESDIHLISTKTPAPQCQPIDRNNRKGKY